MVALAAPCWRPYPSVSVTAVRTALPPPPIPFNKSSWSTAAGLCPLPDKRAPSPHRALLTRQRAPSGRRRRRANAAATSTAIRLWRTLRAWRIPPRGLRSSSGVHAYGGGARCVCRSAPCALSVVLLDIGPVHRARRPRESVERAPSLGTDGEFRRVTATDVLPRARADTFVQPAGGRWPPQAARGS